MRIGPIPFAVIVLALQAPAGRVVAGVAPAAVEVVAPVDVVDVVAAIAVVSDAFSVRASCVALLWHPPKHTIASATQTMLERV